MNLDHYYKVEADLVRRHLVNDWGGWVAVRNDKKELPGLLKSETFNYDLLIDSQSMMFPIGGGKAMRIHFLPGRSSQSQNMLRPSNFNGSSIPNAEEYITSCSDSSHWYPADWKDFYPEPWSTGGFELPLSTSTTLFNFYDGSWGLVDAARVLDSGLISYKVTLQNKQNTKTPKLRVPTSHMTYEMNPPDYKGALSKNTIISGLRKHSRLLV